MASAELTKTIIDLISQKREGPYWDFKRQWYKEEEKDNLLHDIICMANNLVNRDAYIIIGVDEENDYAPYDIFDDKNKRNTQQLTDFLREKRFAGDSRPMVTVEHIVKGSYMVDVIIIHNSDQTPFYLTERERSVRPYSIYTRVQDTNTPIDKSADIRNVELLWRKRFGILLSPLEKVRCYLKDPNEWVASPYNDGFRYYKYAPEFTIGYCSDSDDNRTGKMYFHFYQTDSQARWGNILIKYHQTVISGLIGIVLDGGRYLSPCPLIDGISINGNSLFELSYRYFVKNSLDYDVHQFYFDRGDHEQVIAHNNLTRAILLFDSEEEHYSFNDYVQRKWASFECDENKLFLPWTLNEEVSESNEIYRKQAIQAQKLRIMLLAFRHEY